MTVQARITVFTRKLSATFGDLPDEGRLVTEIGDEFRVGFETFGACRVDSSVEFECSIGREFASASDYVEVLAFVGSGGDAFGRPE